MNFGPYKGAASGLTPLHLETRFGTNLLEASIERDLGALKGLTRDTTHPFGRLIRLYRRGNTWLAQGGGRGPRDGREQPSRSEHTWYRI